MNKKRLYTNIMKIHAKESEGGGKTNVERKMSMNITEMYQRMMKTGEMAEAMYITSNNKNSRERAEALLNNAKRAPLYMSNKEHHDLTENMSKIDKKLKAKKKQMDEDLKLNHKVELEISKREANKVWNW